MCGIQMFGYFESWNYFGSCGNLVVSASVESSRTKSKHVWLTEIPLSTCLVLKLKILIGFIENDEELNFFFLEKY